MKTPDAFSKLLFCAGMAADLRTFFGLLYRTKQYAFYRNRAIDHNKSYDIFQVKLLQKILPLKLRTFSGDFDMFYETFWRKTYALPTVLQGVSVIVDLGANIGMTALWWADLFPDTRIIAVEPDPDNYDVLVENTRSIPRCQTIHAAIGGTDGTAWLQRTRYSYNTTVSEGGNIKVAQWSMPSLINECRLAKIDLLKIDIEGAEIFLGSSNTGWLQMVSNIIIEIHQGCEEIIEVLKASGFRHLALGGYSEGLHFFSKAD